MSGGACSSGAVVLTAEAHDWSQSHMHMRNKQRMHGWWQLHRPHWLCNAPSPVAGTHWAPRTAGSSVMNYNNPTHQRMRAFAMRRLSGPSS